ncbi:hypothetical protein GCM10007416_16990 [Kroppenstedtia guangzhouensis]|uniref:Uncharacterized protein n=1 Tax=Kroppenstedtia guangzhouensis TaxID=1274356 RepID=A0ABQ1GJ49_9BACL|nr:hypothetical protein GCM10007416_16990 [Kroppenstedtia guangzhouensis]
MRAKSEPGRVFSIPAAGKGTSDHRLVYVLLTPDQGHWKVKSIHSGPPNPKERIRARATTTWWFNPEREEPKKIIHLRYGLEQYCAPENTKRALKESRQSMTVRVKVAPWGQAKITGIE